MTIGLDLGTSGVRALALSESGDVVARARRAYPTSRPEPGAAEQSVDDWMDAAGSALREVSRIVPSSLWLGIGLSAMLPTLVLRDSSGRVTAPAITWEDARAESDAREFLAQVGEERAYRTTGQRIDGRYLLPMAMRMRRLDIHAPDALVAGAKDHLFAELTGTLLTDPSTASGYGAFDLRTGRWDDEMLGAADVAGVPDIAPSNTALPLRTSLARKWGLVPGIPVVLGAADSVLGAHGLGVREPGAIAYIAGTSTVIFGCVDQAAFDPDGRYLVTPAATEGFGLEMDILATGAAFGWLSGLLRLEGPAEAAELAASTATSDNLRVFPYLSPGEQGALWDSTLTGAIVGTTLETTPADLARALHDALIIESRRCIGVLDDTFASAGVPQDADIRVTGSSASTSAFRQDLADATGRTVTHTVGEADHSAIGAAMLAASAVGEDCSIGGGPREIYEPREELHDVWAQRFEAHDAMRHALFNRRD